MPNLTIVNDERLNALVEEIEAIVVEKAYEFQSARLELYWLTGEAIRQYTKDTNENVTDVVNAIASDNRLSGKQMSVRNLWWAVKIFDEFPTKDFPEEKAATLSKVKKYLTDGGKVEECDHAETETVCRCVKCKKVI